MIIIIEGVDGVGKTTLAGCVAFKLETDLWKESYTNKEELKKERVEIMLDNVLKEGKLRDIVYDRTTLIDDFVYSFLDGKESCLEKYKDIIKTILDHTIIVHLDIDEKIRRQRFDSRGDEYVTNNDIEKIRTNYEIFYNSMNLKHLYRIQLCGQLEKDVDKIIETIKNDVNFTYSAN